MRTIRISEEVWKEMEKFGKFGETADDVLRRVFHINQKSQEPAKPRTRYAERKMPCYIADNNLVVEFVGGPSKKFALPPRSDKMAIRKVRDEAVAFAKDNGASDGQIAAVKKTLTEADYLLTK